MRTKIWKSNTTNPTERQQKESPETNTKREKKNKLPVVANNHYIYILGVASTVTDCISISWVAIYLSIWHMIVCVALFWSANVCVQGEHPAQPPPLRPHLIRHHDKLCHMTGREPEVDRTMLLVLAISFRDNKRQQKGFQRKYSSIALYLLNLGYWFKYETCTPQEKWQTSTSLSFFFIFFPPFAQI